MLRPRRTFQFAVLGLLCASCSDGGMSPAEAEQEAEKRVRQTYGLAPHVDLTTRVFVGRPRDGDVVLCGITTDPAGRIPAQRFIAATDPARWLQMALLDSASIHAQPDKFVEWTQHCAGAEGDAAESPTQVTRTEAER